MVTNRSGVLPHSDDQLIVGFTTVGFWAGYLMDWTEGEPPVGLIRLGAMFLGLIAGVASALYFWTWIRPPSMVMDEYLGVSLGFWGYVTMQHVRNGW